MNSTEMDTMYDLGVQDAAASIQAGSGAGMADLLSMYKKTKDINSDKKSQIAEAQAKLMTQIL
jgi:hypothetical protein